MNEQEIRALHEGGRSRGQIRTQVVSSMLTPHSGRPDGSTGILIGWAGILVGVALILFAIWGDYRVMFTPLSIGCGLLSLGVFSLAIGHIIRAISFLPGKNQ